MKIGCNNCGIHFPQDFDTTFKPPCNFWGDAGMANLDTDLKKKLWDWIFMCPSDEIFIKNRYGISFEFRGIAQSEDTQFIKVVPGYKDMTELEQQEFQRKYFKNLKQGKETVINAVPVPKKERIIN